MGQFLVLQTDGRLKYPEITKSTRLDTVRDLEYK